MAKIQNTAQFVTYSATYNMSEKRSALKNDVQQVITMSDIKDDIREAYIPYETVYRTMLSQSSTGEVKERVLNRRDPDFFYISGSSGLLGFTRSEAGVYSTGAIFEDLDLTLLSFTPRYSETSAGKIYVEIVNDALVITTFDGEGAADSILDDFVIEFRYRLRGADFQALVAEMNASGNEIAITMSENINSYGLDAEALLDAFVIDAGESTITNTLIGYEDDVLVLSFSADPALTSESVVTVTYDASAYVESLDLGLLDEFDAMAVVNNIPEEEE